MSGTPDDGDRGRFDMLAKRRWCSARAPNHTIAVTSRLPAIRIAGEASAERLRVAPMVRPPLDWWPTTARAGGGAG
jgi:hypothetical protein